MTHGGNTGRGDASYTICHFRPAFEFNSVTTCFRHKTAGVANGRFDAGLVTHVGHIADQPGIRRASSYSLGMANHIVHRHRQGAIISQHRHSQAVTDQYHVYTSLFLEPSVARCPSAVGC